MKHKIALCVGLTAFGVAGVTSAHAQGFYVGPPRVYVAPPRVYAAPPVMYRSGLAPGEILMRVRAAGLSPLTQPARRGTHYVLLASDRMGGQLQVMINAYDGRILRVTPTHDPRFAYHPARPQAVAPPPVRYSDSAAPSRPELKDPPPFARSNIPLAPPAVRRDTASTPPASIDTAPPRLASAPPVVDPARSRPARTPLPRPRPATASNETATAPQAAETVVAAPTTPAAPQPPVSAPAVTTQKAAPARRAETQMVPVAPLD